MRVTCFVRSLVICQPPEDSVSNAPITSLLNFSAPVLVKNRLHSTTSVDGTITLDTIFASLSIVYRTLSRIGFNVTSTMRHLWEQRLQVSLSLVPGH